MDAGELDPWADAGQQRHTAAASSSASSAYYQAQQDDQGDGFENADVAAASGEPNDAVYIDGGTELQRELLEFSRLSENEDSDNASLIVHHSVEPQVQLLNIETRDFDPARAVDDVRSQVVTRLEEQRLSIAHRLQKVAAHWNLPAGDILRAVEEHRVDINQVDDDGHTALMNAAVAGDETVLNFLLQHAASTNVQSRYGYTALMYSCSYGRTVVLQLLLEAGANTELRRYNGDRAREIAAHPICGFPFILKILDDYGAPL